MQCLRSPPAIFQRAEHHVAWVCTLHIWELGCELVWAAAACGLSAAAVPAACGCRAVLACELRLASFLPKVCNAWQVCVF